MKKFYTEMSYLLGIIALAAGTVLMEKANFGMSMVVAPAYLVYIKLSSYYAWFSFGMAEYCLQAVLLILLTIVMKRFSSRYLLSFVTAFFYGNVLDLLMGFGVLLPVDSFIWRVIWFCIGMIVCALGVSLLFHTYISPEAYELVVKEVSAKYGFDIHRVKTVYDCSSCLIAVIMSFAFMGLWHFEGVKLGTIICALINGSIIGWFSRLLEKHFEFTDALKNTNFPNIFSGPQNL